MRSGPKALFIKEPANMRLLVVVDKLLTGFDAPPCTYLYIDKSMQDHGLFQAICRTNRLDGDDKDFGYIVDYKDLFKKVENAIAVYTSELDHSAGGSDPEVLLQDRMKKGRERLDEALEALDLLCEPVEPPRGELEHIRYFCGNTEVASDLQEREPQRVALYKGAAALMRAYANIADELDRAGYSGADIARIKQRRDHYLNMREIVRKASGESIDLKAYEADMRHLIDTYIEADEPRKISPFDNMSLLDLIVKTGIANAINNQLGGMKGNREAIAETIENNVRSKIIKEHLNDPAYFEAMSALLDEIIKARKAKAVEYEEYLGRIAELAKRVEAGQSDETPKTLDTPGKRALYNNLGQNEGLAIRIDETVRRTRPDGWRGVQAREQVIKAALYGVLQRCRRSGTHLPDHQGAKGILMITELQLGEITVDVVQKDIKNVHLSVYPPTGRVRISAPLRMTAETIRVFAISKIGWIKQQQAKLQSQDREPPREYLDRESHYVWGKRYLLQVVEDEVAPRVEVQPGSLVLRVRPGADDATKEAVIAGWYRHLLRVMAPPLIHAWEPRLNVAVSQVLCAAYENEVG